jgi:hypothetical protein
MSSESVVKPAAVPNQRSLFGPVVLIFVGLVFLLVNIGRLSAIDVLVAFAKYWPVFIIFWGVSKLFEHWSARRYGRRASGLGFGGVLLLIFLIVMGSAATSAYRSSGHINWAGVREGLSEHDDLGLFFGRKFEYTQTLDHPLPAGRAVKIIADRGSVRVLSSPDDSVHLIVRKSVYSYEEPDAIAIAQRVMPQLTETGEELQIDGTRHGDWAGARMSMEIQVPAKARVELNTRRTEAELRGRSAPVKIDAWHGRVTLEDVGAAVDARVDAADITLRNIRGDVVVDGRISDASLTNVDGAVDLHGDVFGDIRMSRVAKNVRMRTARTELELRRLDGEMRMSHDIFRLNAATGPLRLRTRSKDIDLDAVSGDVRLENKDGEIELRPDTQAPLGNIEIANRSGAIRLRLPATSGFEVDARADHGEIHSDFDLRASKEGENARATGVVNKGGAKVSVATERGNILLRRN